MITDSATALFQTLYSLMIPTECVKVHVCQEDPRHHRVRPEVTYVML